MGIRVNIGGTTYEADSYTVTEDSTPTKSNDSSGSVGTLTFEIQNVENAFLLEGKEVSLVDTRRGTTVGFVTEVSEQDNSAVSVECQSRLGRLNIYGVQAQPQVGTLQDAFRYYVGLANQTTDILVDPAIAGRPVVFPGWYGELWFHMKQMAAAQDCELALVSNVILLRPLRTREAIDHRNTSRSRTYGGATLAQAVEVYCYDNKPITNQLVYPPGGWNPEVEVITVGAGEEIERTVELSASVEIIQPPVMQTFVSNDHRTSSVYTIVGDDGFPIQPQQWSDYGGLVTVTIDPDTTSLTVFMRGATGIQSTKGEAVSTFSLALGSDFTGNRYSTLRIVGSGVSFNKQSVNVRTCVDPKLTGTEIGVTIDNPFLSTWDEAYSAGVKAAKLYAGERMVLSGNVTSINQLGDSGSARYPTYEFDQSQNQGRTYAQVQTVNAGQTYQSIEQSYFDIVRDDFDNQVFGNSGGVRIWDRQSRRWFRNRSGSIDTTEVSFSAEDDLLHDDMLGRYGNVTYYQEGEMFQGMTYSQRDRMGLFFTEVEALPDTNFPSLTRYPSLTDYPRG